MNIQDSLEILLRWLEDNVEMETDILFSDNVDSTAMIPAVQAAIALAENANTAPLMPMSQYLSSITTVDNQWDRRPGQQH